MPFFDKQIGSVRLIGADASDVLPLLEKASFDAVVCDPPYAVNMMERAWDNFKSPQAFESWCHAWASLTLPLVKPGGHILAFGGTRTYHRLASGIEDAGFELRDMLEWFYGTGWSKAHDASKIVDAFVLFGQSDSKAIKKANEARSGKERVRASTQNRGIMGEKRGSRIIRDEPATEEGKKWQGWANALKPAHEPILLARKPIEGRLPENLLRYQNGALNIEATKIAKKTGERSWPANVVLDEEAAQFLDEIAGRKDSPSSFFYCPKASTRERNAGLQEKNTHDTVKPIELMRWLVRMVSRPGALVLDPFAGSGTTGIACMQENVNAILIEKDPKHIKLAEERLQYYASLSTS